MKIIRRAVHRRFVAASLLSLLLVENPTLRGDKNKLQQPGTRISVTDVGAIPDGTTLNTAKIQSAIDQLARKGGGTIIIPKGVFLTGAIFLKPYVNIHLEKDAVLKGITEMSSYPPRRIRIEGHFEEHYTPGLLNAENCDGLQITGEGTLDGTGRPIWDQFWKLRNAAKDKKNFKNLSIPRAQLCIINNSKNIVIDGPTFKDSQYWNLHLYNCSNALVQNARFQVPDDYKQAPSTDGIDIDSCQNVTIKTCYFSVTDDCIALKGSKGPDALNDKTSPPVEHVRISDCTFKRGGGVTLGSEATIVRDVIVERCRFTGADHVLNFKLRPDTPQHYEDIQYRDITLQSSNGTLISIYPWHQYSNFKDQQPPKSIVQNITLSDVKGHYGKFGSIQGNPGQTTLSEITLQSIDVQLKDPSLKVASEVKNLKLENVTINGKAFSLAAAQ